MNPCNSLELPASLERLEALATPKGAARLLRWACERFSPRIILTSSFQTQSLPLLHLVSRLCPQLPVLFIDTGFHFEETLAFRDRVAAALGLNLVVVRPAMEHRQFIARYGEDVPYRDPDLCCRLNKVEPMQRALVGVEAWIAGVRRDQTSYRRHLRVVACHAGSVVRIHPMLNWTAAEVEAYRRRYALPAHPLYALGYRSIGCKPCTRPSLVANPRAGRWDGRREECGLHLALEEVEEER